MPVQVLGIFERIFDWVFAKILDPILQWFAGIVQTIFEFLFENVIGPFLNVVLGTLMNAIGYTLLDFFYMGVYSLYCCLLELVSVLQHGFDILIGLEDITYYVSVGGQTVERQDTLLNYLINYDATRTILIAITIAAFGLAMLFAIYATIRSTLDFDFENKRPVGKVLGATMKTMISFLIVPFLMYVGISLASVVLKQVAAAISLNQTTSISDMIFCVSSMDAARDPDIAFSLTSEPWSSVLDGTKGYLGIIGSFHISKIDYFVGFTSTIFVMIIMTMCLFTFIKRIFEILMLFVTSQYFASTMVLDDGQKFSKWREAFISKLIVGFGAAIAMRLFLMLIPVIMDEKLQFFENAIMEATGGYLIKLIFILGGMYAVYKSTGLLASVFGGGAGGGAGELAGLAMARGLGHKIGSKATSSAKQSLAKSRQARLDAAAEKAKGNKFNGGDAAGSQKFNGGTDADAKKLGKDGAKADAAKDTPTEKLSMEDFEMPMMSDDDALYDLRDLFAEQGDFGDLREADFEMPMEHFYDLNGKLTEDDFEMPFGDLDGKLTMDDFEMPLEAKEVNTGKVTMDDSFGSALDSALADSDLENKKANGGLITMDDSFAAALDREADNSAPKIDTGTATMSEGFSSTLDNLQSNYSQHDTMTIGKSSYNIPAGYTAFPRLVRKDKAADHVNSMKAGAQSPEMKQYYNDLGSRVTRSDYSAPTFQNSGGSTTDFGNLGGKNRVPEGYCIVPEIIPVNEAKENAELFSKGRGANADFFKEYSKHLDTQNNFGSENTTD